MWTVDTVGHLNLDKCSENLCMEDRLIKCPVYCVIKTEYCLITHTKKAYTFQTTLIIPAS